MAQDLRDKKLLAAAAILAGAGGLGLIALGWWVIEWQPRYDWGRLSDSHWWTSVAMRGLGLLSLSSIGFKVALACVVGLGGGWAWLRNRRRRPSAEKESATNGGEDKSLSES